MLCEQGKTANGIGALGPCQDKDAGDCFAKKQAPYPGGIEPPCTSMAHALSMESSTRQRWNASLIDSSTAKFVTLNQDNHVASRLSGSAGPRVRLCADTAVRTPGVHYFVVSIKGCPVDHVGDPLELGVLASLPHGKFRSVGYATEGRLRGGAVFQDGAPLFSSVSGVFGGGGSTLGLEVTVPPSSASSVRWPSVRFLVDREYVSKPVELSRTQLPIVPVATLPEGCELEILEFNSTNLRGAFKEVVASEVATPSKPLHSDISTMQHNAGVSRNLTSLASLSLSAPADGEAKDDDADDDDADEVDDEVDDCGLISAVSHKHPFPEGQVAATGYTKVARGLPAKFSSIASTALLPALAAEEAADSSSWNFWPLVGSADEEAAEEAALREEVRCVARGMVEAVAESLSSAQASPAQARRHYKSLPARSVPESAVPSALPASAVGDEGKDGDNDAYGSVRGGRPAHFVAEMATAPPAAAFNEPWEEEQEQAARSSPSQGVFAVGSTVLVSGKGRGVVLRVLANRWRRVKLQDGAELSLKQRDLLQLDGDGFADLEPPPGLEEVAAAAKEKARQKLAAAMAIVSMASVGSGSEDSRGDDGSGDGVDQGLLGRGVRGSRRGLVPLLLNQGVVAAAAAAAAAVGTRAGTTPPQESSDSSTLGQEEAGSSFSWICCDACNRWRRLPEGVKVHEVCDQNDDGAEWRCDLNYWDSYNRCWVEEERDDGDEEEEHVGGGGGGAFEEERHEKKPFKGLASFGNGGRGGGGGRRKPLGRPPTKVRNRLAETGNGEFVGVGETAEPPLRNSELVRPEELGAVVQGLGCESCWALPCGRLVCWAEDRGYCVAHAGETLVDVARDFHCEVEEMLLLNTALEAQLKTDSVLTAGSTLLLPWLEDESSRMWHDLTNQLLADGWRLEWAQDQAQNLPPSPSSSSRPSLSSSSSSSSSSSFSAGARGISLAPDTSTAFRRTIAYFPPPNAQALALAHAANDKSAHTLSSLIHDFGRDESPDTAQPRKEGGAGASLTEVEESQEALGAFQGFSAGGGCGRGVGWPPSPSTEEQQQQQQQKPLGSLEEVVRAYPGVLSTLDLVCPATALERLRRLFSRKTKIKRDNECGDDGGHQSMRKRNKGGEKEVAAAALAAAAAVEVLKPSFFPGDWVLAQWPHDGLWYFAKVTRRRLLGAADLLPPPPPPPSSSSSSSSSLAAANTAAAEPADGVAVSYDLEYEDGGVELCKSPHSVREPLGREAKQPRGTGGHRFYYSEERGGGWLAFWRGVWGVPGGPWPSLPQAENALGAFRPAKSAATQDRGSSDEEEEEEEAEEEAGEGGQIDEFSFGDGGKRGIGGSGNAHEEVGEEEEEEEEERLRKKHANLSAVIAAAASPRPFPSGGGGIRGNKNGPQGLVQATNHQLGRGVCCPVCLEVAYTTAAASCVEGSARNGSDSVMESLCCGSIFHKTCLDSIPPASFPAPASFRGGEEGRAGEALKSPMGLNSSFGFAPPGASVACPSCLDAPVFHRQLRALKRFERFGSNKTACTSSSTAGSLDLSNAGGTFDGETRSECGGGFGDCTALLGREVVALSGVAGVVQALDRCGRLVLTLSDGKTVCKVRPSALVSCARQPKQFEFQVAHHPHYFRSGDGALPAAAAAEAWKVPAPADFKAAEAAAARVADLEEAAGERTAVERKRLEHRPFPLSPRKENGFHVAPSSYSSSSSSSSSTAAVVAAASSTASSRGNKPMGSAAAEAEAAAASAAKRIQKGSGPQFLAPGGLPGPRQWGCELCRFLNTQFTRRCASCLQGSQARSMVGRTVRTTSGPGVVAKSSGKGWVVVETKAGGSYRMRLSRLWDYTTATTTQASPTAATSGTASRGGGGGVSEGCDGGGFGGASLGADVGGAAVNGEADGEAEGGGEGGDISDDEVAGIIATTSGFALPLPAHRAGDPGMPKNWSFSLLNKRVATKQGVGVVTTVIDKGWIEVRLDSGSSAAGQGQGRKIKTRPGNVTALEGDPEVITAFAKKTKATANNIASPASKPTSHRSGGSGVFSQDKQLGCRGGSREKRQQQGEPLMLTRKRARHGNSPGKAEAGGEVGDDGCSVRSEKDVDDDDDDDEEVENGLVFDAGSSSARGVAPTNALLRAVALERALVSKEPSAASSAASSPASLTFTDTATRPYKVNEAIECQLPDSSWAPGVVEYAHQGNGGTLFSVLLDTGEVEEGVPPHRLRAS